MMLDFDYSTLDQKTINEIKQDHNLNFRCREGILRRQSEVETYRQYRRLLRLLLLLQKEDPKLNRN